MKTTDCRHYRQGDVLIERIVSIPSAAEPQKPSPRIILAHGEATGHHHALETSDPAHWWRATEIAAAANQQPATLAGVLFVTLPTGGVVTHQEHSAIQLPAGNYRIARQREYSPEAIRTVAD